MMALHSSVRRLVLVGMLVAVAIIGSYIKLGPMSIAFDAAAGFLAALLLGPAAGALVCGLGHLAVAGLTGFPLSLPFHLATAVAMAGVGAAGGLAVRRFGLIAAGVTMVLANGLAAPAALSLLPNPMGTGLFAVLWLPLTLAAAANAFVAVTVAGLLQARGYRA